MGKKKGNRKSTQLWAEFRFSVIGRLFSNPPPKGELKRTLQSLSDNIWNQPITGEKVKFAYKTIEEWYYHAKKSNEPIEALRRKSRQDIGHTRALTDGEKKIIIDQYHKYKSWTYKLHADNFNVFIESNPCSGEKRSYPTIMRFMKSAGLFKQKRERNSNRPGFIASEKIREKLEVRSFESEYVNALYHLDFHSCSRQVLLEDGTWKTPQLLCVLDDRSRLICHIQWYLNEDTEALTHGVIQAFQKRGLPRALMSDNGSAMLSSEFTEGLMRLSVTHETTLPYSPYQNGKQECIWGQVEGRLIAMLENYKDLTLKFLNDTTQAWAEMEYNIKEHSEINAKPLDRYLNDKNVGRPSPGFEDLKKIFMTEETRTQRKSDGTISISGKRYEIPNRFRHIRKITIRYAKWNLSDVYISDERNGNTICRIYPVNKIRNSSGERRVLESPVLIENDNKPSGREIPPLLAKLISDYSATGLPPAYIPEDRKDK